VSGVSKSGLCAIGAAATGKGAATGAGVAAIGAYVSADTVPEISAAVSASCIAVSVASNRSTSEPSLTLSPTLTHISLTTPSNGAGTSSVDLSDSRTISVDSRVMVSPGWTSISMTGTSLKFPRSGTRTWCMAGSACPGCRIVSAHAVALDRLGNCLRRQKSLSRQPLECCYHDAAPVNFKEPAQ
jgi:hypothetical protein